MGCDLYITRKTNWSGGIGPDISPEEWESLLFSDADLQPYARDENGDLNAYLNGPICQKIKAWGRNFSFDYGHVRVKRPNRETLSKMVSIAIKLNARVIGDHGEIYHEDGTMLGETGLFLEERYYSEMELDCATLLTPYNLDQLGEGFVQGNRIELGLYPSSVSRWGSQGFWFFNDLCCREDVRLELEAAGLRHLQFEEMEVVYPENFTGSRSRVYRLTSDLILPPTTNWMGDYRANVWKSSDPVTEFPNGSYRFAPLHQFAEPHYRAKDLQSAPEFDFALTHERIGDSGGCQRDCVCSQRFRAVLKSLGLWTEYSPVRVDDAPWEGGIDATMHPRYTFAGKPEGPFVLPSE